jgi:hypothetical protein
MQNGTATMKSHMMFPQKSKIEIPYDEAIILLDKPKALKAGSEDVVVHPYSQQHCSPQWERRSNPRVN